MDIIEKVSLWRKLYNGVLIDDKIIRYSLDDSSYKVGITKKSLDDYLLQLRFGRKYGFDFVKYKNCKVGTLRTFVRKQKDIEKESLAPKR
jgi:cell division protein FtsI/penicillin-binding protein 2